MTEPTPARTQIVRPGAEPTHDDPAGGKRWHYLNLDGSKMDPPTFIYEHVSGGFGGECANQCYPDRLFTPPPVPKNGIGNRIACELSDRGFEVIDPPEWWAEAQRVRAALPERTRLAGPTGDGDPWLVCTDTPEGRAIGSWAPSPTAALREAIKSWTLHARETQITIDTLYRMLREAGYSPDPAGLRDALRSDGPCPPTDTGTVTIDPPRSLQVFSITIPGRAVIEVHPDHIRIDR